MLARLAVCAAAAFCLAPHSALADVNLVSTGPQETGTPATMNGVGFTPNGIAVFRTTQSLTADDGDTSQDWYRRSGSTTTLLTPGPFFSIPTPNTSIQAGNREGVTDDGRIVFETTENIGSDSDGLMDVFALNGGSPILVSTNTTAKEARLSGWSGDGRTVVFWTRESLAAADTDSNTGSCVNANNCADLYKTRDGGLPTFVSTGSAADNDASIAGLSPQAVRQMSNNGAAVLFHSDADLSSTIGEQEPPDFYMNQDVGGTSLVSWGPGAVAKTGPDNNMDAGASTDFSKAIFETHWNLPGDDDNAGNTDVWLNNTGQTTSSLATPNTPNSVSLIGPNQPDTRTADLSAFLVQTDLGSGTNIYRVSNGSFVLMAPFNGTNFRYWPSADLQKVAFTTVNSLVPGDTDTATDVYVGTGNGDYTLVSDDADSATDPEVAASFGGISANGNKVVFQTSEDLHADDTDSAADIYAYRFAGPAGLEVVTKDGPADQLSAAATFADPSIANERGRIMTSDGKKIFFKTTGRLVATDTDSAQDIYVASELGKVAINDAEVEAPESGTVDMEFTISLPVADPGTVSVDWETEDGTGANGAKAGTDYTQSQGTATFQPGQLSKTITVPVKANGFQVDKTFSVKLSNPVNTTIEDDVGTGTIRGRGPLQVTITPEQPSVDVEQTAQGPVTKDVKVVVAVKNRGDTTIDSVSVPDKLTLGWDMPAPAMGFPITQTKPESLDLGSIPPGETKSATYTLHVTGDGKFTLEALVLGDGGGQTLRALGTTKFEADTRLLVQSGELGARVRSQRDPNLIQAGTQFLINVTLENRSTYRKIVVEPIYPKLDGNASDGHLTERDGSSTAPPVEGSLDEVQPSNWLELPPGAKREYVSVVRTNASDAFQDVPIEGRHEGMGGTRATVDFEKPVTHVVAAANQLVQLPSERVVMVDGSSHFAVSIDDSGPQPPPFDAWDAAWYFSKGGAIGLWRLTFGTLRSVLELPPALFFGAIDVSMGTLHALDRLVELWTSIEDDPSARGDFIGTVYNKVAATFAAAPDALALAPSNLFQLVSDAVGNKMTALAKQWKAGDWRAALEEATAGGGEGAATVAMSLGPGVLARLPAVAARWNTLRTATYARIGTRLAPVVKRITQGRAAAKALADVVRPGFEFGATHMSKIFGVSSTEMKRVAQYAQAHKLSIVLRSRAQQSIGFLEKKVAVLKPYWIKSKNVNEIDAAFLGYSKSDIGKVIMKGKLPSKKQVIAEMKSQGVTEDNPLYAEVLGRLKTRLKEQRGEFRQMKKWHEAKKVKGKWPWKDNGVDPLIQADEESIHGFRLLRHPDPKKGPDYLPQILVKGEKPAWKFITGDIDLIAITRADGRALSNVEHVQHLKALKVLIGAQHPESATWVMDGKFWFKAKRNYLNNDGECCLAQFGGDGKVRAVEFNEKLSEPEKWTKLNYRIYWNGGYQVGLGQK